LPDALTLLRGFPSASSWWVELGCEGCRESAPTMILVNSQLLSKLMHSYFGSGEDDE
jgi:hypothetical protein